MLAWPWLDFDSVLRHTTGTRYEFDLIVVYSLVRITQWVWGLKPLGARSSEAPKGEKGRKKRNSNRQKPLSAENLPLLVAATGKCWRNIDVINFERFFLSMHLKSWNSRHFLRQFLPTSKNDFEKAGISLDILFLSQVRDQASSYILEIVWRASFDYHPSFPSSRTR